MYEDALPPGMRERFLELNNDPDLLSLQPEIERLEKHKSELEARLGEGGGDPKLRKAVESLKRTLAKLRRSEARRGRAK